MMERRTAFLLLAVVAATLLGVMPATAEVSQMSVKVDGLACPFCVYGIEKKLRNVDSIRDVNVDLETGLARITLVEGKVPTLAEVRNAVKKAGFTPRQVSATVIGTPVIENGSVILRVRGSERTYFLSRQGKASDHGPAEALHERLLAQANRRHAPIVVRGVLRQRDDGSTGLSVNAVEKLGEGDASSSTQVPVGE